MRPEIVLDEFIVMPNHFHGIIHIVDTDVPDIASAISAGAHRRAPTPFARNWAHVGAPTSNAFDATGAHVGAPISYDNNWAHVGAPLRRPAGSLGSVIAGFKSTVTTQINAICGTPRRPVWQSRYHERVIRTEQSLRRIRAYIRNNPMQWHLDKQNPKYGL
jgi:REP element-mobilizing transposase RayT